MSKKLADVSNTVTKTVYTPPSPQAEAKAAADACRANLLRAPLEHSESRTPVNGQLHVVGDQVVTAKASDLIHGSARLFEGGGETPHMLRLELQLQAGLASMCTGAGAGGNPKLFLIVADKSGSMRGRPWEQVREAVLNIAADSFQPGSGCEVQLIAYNSRAEAVPITPANFRKTVGSLRAGGGTDFVHAFAAVATALSAAAGSAAATASAATAAASTAAAAAAYSSACVVFMTDGRGKGGAAEAQALQGLQRRLSKMQMRVTVHAVGFSANHNFRFLDSVRMAGNVEGAFRYAEPGDGPDALRGKLTQIFDSVAQQTVALRLTLPGYTLPTPDAATDTTTDTAPVFDVELGEDGALQLDSAVTTTDTAAAAAAAAAVAAAATAAAASAAATGGGGSPPLSLQVSMCAGAVTASFTLPVTLMEMGTLVRLQWEAQCLLLRCRALVATAVAVRNDAPVADDLLAKRREQEAAVGAVKTRVFSSGRITRAERAQVFSILEEAQSCLDAAHSLLAARVRVGVTASVSALARANDIRFNATFNKSRRAKLMECRALRNGRALTSLDTDLQALDDARRAQAAAAAADADADADAVGTVVEAEAEARDFFSCTLTCLEAGEVMEDGAAEVLGMCLAVARPETAVDEPCALRILSLSSTLATRSAMEEATRHAVCLQGHLRAHGGFAAGAAAAATTDGDGASTSSGNGSSDNTSSGSAAAAAGAKGGKAGMGVVMVGRSREPINAWLPLYINAEHGERVQLLLRPCLGYFCTLDPLGFCDKQHTALFHVLGTMLSRCVLPPRRRRCPSATAAAAATAPATAPATVASRRQLRLVLAFARTCAFVAARNGLFPAMRATLAAWMGSVEGRLPEHVPSMTLLLAYLAVLPPQQLQELALLPPSTPSAAAVATTADAATASAVPVSASPSAGWCALWRGVGCELLRRSATRVMADTPPSLIQGFIASVLQLQPLDHTAAADTVSATEKATGLASTPRAAAATSAAAAAAGAGEQKSAPVGAAEAEGATRSVGSSFLLSLGVRPLTSAAADRATASAVAAAEALPLPPASVLRKLSASHAALCKAAHGQLAGGASGGGNAGDTAAVVASQQAVAAAALATVDASVGQAIDAGTTHSPADADADADAAAAADTDMAPAALLAAATASAPLCAAVSRRLAAAAFPSVTALRSACAFLRGWLPIVAAAASASAASSTAATDAAAAAGGNSGSGDSGDSVGVWAAMDANAGLPPAHWLDSITAALRAPLWQQQPQQQQPGVQPVMQPAAAVAAATGMESKEGQYEEKAPAPTGADENGAEAGAGAGVGVEVYGSLGALLTEALAGSSGGGAFVADDASTHLFMSAAVIQALRLRATSRVRAAADKGTLHQLGCVQAAATAAGATSKEESRGSGDGDSGSGSGSDSSRDDTALAILCASAARLLHKRRMRAAAAREQGCRTYRARVLLRLRDPWAFAGMLVATEAHRGEFFARTLQLLADGTSAGDGATPSDMLTQLAVLLGGCLEGQPVYCKGNALLPTKALRSRLVAVCDGGGDGGGGFLQLEATLRSMTAQHVYRGGAAVANRHGHSNDNPYGGPTCHCREKGQPKCRRRRR